MMHPTIDPRIFKLAPGFRVISITVKSAPITKTTLGSEKLDAACKLVLNNEPSWAEAHLASWFSAYQAFGAKPKRTPCSAEALRKRVLKDKSMPHIDPIVDLYNAISLKYAIPVGGENKDAYISQPFLTIADGTEKFDISKSGELTTEFPEMSEVIWRDENGVTCRRWNWRQCVRTRLSSTDKNMWFILESLPSIPIEELKKAANEFITDLTLMMPGAEISQELISE